VQSQSPLLASYLERRADMRRFFLAKLGPDADVEDLVQDLYLKVIALQDEPVNNPPAFLYRLASNLMLDRLRQRRRAGARDADWRSTHQTSSRASGWTRSWPPWRRCPRALN
jgi:DNA-directed RNA polymerase specialized sigma24 family protein